MTDTRYINAEQAVDRIEEIYCKECDNGNEVLCRSCGYMDCIEMIEEMIESEDFPNADVQEVKHGKWLDTTHEILMPTHRYNEFTNPFSIFFATCSVCRITTNNEGCLNGYSYCPHCGAKMSVDITGDELVEKLWNEFTDIPIDPVTERLETNFYGFAARTSKLSVWAWFKNYHSKGIEYLLYEYEAKE